MLEVGSLPAVRQVGSLKLEVGSLPYNLPASGGQAGLIFCLSYLGWLCQIMFMIFHCPLTLAR